MAVELIYTSAEKGLKPGSHGFCTVAMTEGLPGNVVEKLEGLSGYREHYRANGPQANNNPVNFQYSRFRIGGKIYPILSRVGFAGFDHTGRTNKLAHHIALTDPSEQVDVGPAAMESIAGLFVESWSGAPKTLSPRKLGFPVRAAADCPTWAAVTGDAGWAGAVAQHTIDDPSSIVALIFDPQIGSAAVLRLFNEALALVPPEMRWDVTFSTYLTDLSLETTCRWRATVPGSPELEKLRRLPNVLTIDLTRGKLQPAPDGELTDAACNGRNPYVGRRAPKPTPGPVDYTAGRSSELGSSKQSTYSVHQPLPAHGTPPPQVQVKPDRLMMYAWIGIGVLLVTIVAVAWALFFGPGSHAPIAPNPPAPAPVEPIRETPVTPPPPRTVPQPNNEEPVAPTQKPPVTPTTPSIPPPTTSTTSPTTQNSTTKGSTTNPTPQPATSTTSPTTASSTVVVQHPPKNSPGVTTPDVNPTQREPTTKQPSQAAATFTSEDVSEFAPLCAAWHEFGHAGKFERPSEWSPASKRSLSVAIRVANTADSNNWSIQSTGNRLLITGSINENDVALMELNLDDQGRLISIKPQKQALDFKPILRNGTITIRSAGETLLEFSLVNDTDFSTLVKPKQKAFADALAKANFKAASDFKDELKARQIELFKKQEEMRGPKHPTTSPALDELKKAIADLQAKSMRFNR